MMLTFVRLLRPTVLSMVLSCGVQSLLRTSEVLVRSASTKESLPPLSDFSSVGSDTERFWLVLTSKHSARESVSKMTAQEPCVISVTTSAASSRSETERLYTPPPSMTPYALSSSAHEPYLKYSVSGFMMHSETSAPETIPSSHRTDRHTCPSSPRETLRSSKSAQPEKTSRRYREDKIGLRPNCGGDTYLLLSSDEKLYILGIMYR